MNINNLTLLANHLRKPETAAHFDLEYYHTPSEQPLNSCGTVGCIAGHAVFVARTSTYDYFGEAERWLGLTYRQALDLFTPTDINYADVTASKAADVIDHLIATGEVSYE
jgi:hypothetical protein